MKRLRAVTILVLCIHGRGDTEVNKSASKWVGAPTTASHTATNLHFDRDPQGSDNAASGYDREELLERRRKAQRSIEIAQKMLAATSTEVRSETYCRGRENESFIGMKLFSGGLTPDDWTAILVELMREKPETKSAERARQRELHIVANLLGQHESNVEWCQGLLRRGILALPSDASELELLERAKEEIKNIDHPLAQGATEPAALLNADH